MEARAPFLTGPIPVRTAVFSGSKYRLYFRSVVLLGDDVKGTGASHTPNYFNVLVHLKGFRWRKKKRPQFLMSGVALYFRKVIDATLNWKRLAFGRNGLIMGEWAVWCQKK